MQSIIDFSNCPYSIKHGSYGGQAGDKDGIKYNGQYYIIKYPKAARYFKQIGNMSYVSSPLSEYIGSHIYSILGYDVHSTLLGFRNHKIVVGCKDFCQTPDRQLLEMRTIKNAANKELEDKLGQDIQSSATGDLVNLSEQILHMEYNPILIRTKGVKERFWDTAIIDVLIDNNDRNNGNQGVIVNHTTMSYELAPIFDNGNAFSNKATDEQLAAYLQESEKDLKNRLTGSRTAYIVNGQQLSAKRLLKYENKDLKAAIIRTAPKIQNHMQEIKDFIMSIPETYNGQIICSKIRKEYYIRGIETRFNELILPEYEKIMEKRNERIAMTEQKFANTSENYDNPDNSPRF